MRGQLWMVGATACFTAMITLVKVARSWDFGTLELMSWRAFLAIPVLLLLNRAWRVERWGLLLARCSLGGLAMFCYFTSTWGLGIGEISVLSRLQPLWVALLAPLFLGRQEQAGPVIWAALALGLAGTLALAWPTLGQQDVKLLSLGAMLCSGIFSALAHTCLRGLKDEESTAIVLWFQLFVGSVAVSYVGAFTTPHAPNPLQLLALIGIALSALGGQVMMTWAYAEERAARVAAAAFVAPLMGFGVDLLAFGRNPSLEAIVGGVLIVAAGLLLVREASR